MKKSLATLTFTALALAATLTLGLMGKYSASAESALNSTHTSVALAASSSAMSFAAQESGIMMPRTTIYALNADNTIFVLPLGATSFTRLVRVTQANGNLIGLDYRVSDGNNNSIYAVTDTGSVYTINLTSTGLGSATLVSNLTTRFAGGFQSLMDYNPVLSAIRLIGSNDQNFAVVNSGGNLNVTAAQTAITYPAGDANAGADPNIAGGSYTNNYIGAPFTIFYGVDYDLDTLVTIAPAAAGGSSATGGGKLQTIGPLVTPAGAPVNVAPTADFDIYTNNAGVNGLIGVSGRTLFTIDLAQLNPSLAAGTTQKVVARGITMPDTGGGFIDIAAALTSYEAENATIGGGGKVATVHVGFSGTGFVDFADNVANSFVAFAVNQAGTQTLTFRYGNGSTVNRTCNITLNGTSVGTLSFPPTGAWTTYKTTSLSVNLGTGGGFKALRVTSTTTAGGPNLDKMDVQ